MNRDCDPDTCGCRSDISYKSKKEFIETSKSSRVCNNIQLSHKFNKKVALSKSTLCDSYGLFALEDINQNDYICEYQGEILTKEESDRRSIFNEQSGLNYLFEISNITDIDAYRVGNEMRYILNNI